MTDSGQTIDPAQLERLKTIYGFDQPFYVQYAKWIWGIVSRGDFGYSFEWNQPVAGLIWDRMGSTLVISILSLLFVWIVSLPDRHLFSRAAQFDRRPRLHPHRLSRPRRSQLPARA